MAQMIRYGNELIRINVQQNTIECSRDGRNWLTRCKNVSLGTFLDLVDYGGLIMACTSKGVFSSKDKGQNWHVCCKTGAYGDFLQLAVDGSNLLASTSKGVYYSKDGGYNWHRR